MSDPALRSDPFRGLTKGKGKALEALGVEKLADGEVSKPVRIRASYEVHQRLKEMTAREIGDLLEQNLLNLE